MTYQPLTIDPKKLLVEKLARLERAYVESPGPMPRGAFNQMVQLREELDPKFDKQEALDAYVSPPAPLIAEPVPEVETKPSLLDKLFGPRS